MSDMGRKVSNSLWWLMEGSWNVLVYEKATLALLSLISSWVNLWFQNFDKNILKLSAFLLFLQIHAKQKSGKTIQGGGHVVLAPIRCSQLLASKYHADRIAKHSWRYQNNKLNDGIKWTNMSTSLTKIQHCLTVSKN